MIEFLTESKLVSNLWCNAALPEDTTLSHTGDATLLRRVNQSAVLEILREEGPMARSDIARRLQLSPPTITRIVAGLLESGLVFARDDGASTGGRPS